MVLGLFRSYPRVPSAAADSTLGYHQSCRKPRGTYNSWLLNADCLCLRLLGVVVAGGAVGFALAECRILSADCLCSRIAAYVQTRPGNLEQTGHFPELKLGNYVPFVPGLPDVGVDEINEGEALELPGGVSRSRLPSA